MVLHYCFYNKNHQKEKQFQIYRVYGGIFKINCLGRPFERYIDYLQTIKAIYLFTFFLSERETIEY